MYDLLRGAETPPFPIEYEPFIIMLLPSLTHEERYRYASQTYAQNSLGYFCFLEGTDQFEQALLSIPLSEVPIEPLIRFLCSKPFDEMANWLRREISTPSGLLQRIATMTEAQTRALFLKFPSF